MRIAMVSDYYDVDGKTHGGVQAVTRYLVEEMSRIEWLELHLVMFKQGLKRREQLEQGNHTRHYLPTSRLSAISCYAANQRKLDACLDSIQPDIVHGQGAGSHGIMVSRTEYPSVVTIHGIFAEETQHLSKFRQRMRQRLLIWQSERYCLRRAPNIIAISPYVAKYYGKRIAGEIHFVPNPTDARFFEVKRREEPGRILFAGRIVPIKGVMDLVRAVSELDRQMPMRLILAGALADRIYVKRVRTEVSRLGLENVVDFCGLMDGETLLSEFARCSCLVLPSYQENAPLVVQEAMASGLPVIASRIGGIPHQVTHGETGFLVEPGDWRALRDRLAELLAHASLRNSIAESAKKKAVSEFTAANVVRQTLNVYQHIVKSAAADNSS